MPSDLDKLLTYLEVERLDDYCFVGNSPSHPPRIFGGQVLAQALNAAGRTVGDDLLAHSMHAYFLRPGDPRVQINYEVDPIRDGRSFSTRRVVARQDGTAIFNSAVSFHREEPGLSHQAQAPEVEPPEALESDYDYWRRLAARHPGDIDAPKRHPIERKPVNRRDVLQPDRRSPLQHVWVRGLGDLGNDPRRHQTLLAYMSDFGLLGTALYPHDYSAFDRRVQSASLDHALWFHRPFRADDYLLYSLDSPSAEAARGFSRGSFYTRDGILVASSAQECLLRPPAPDIQDVSN